VVEESAGTIVSGETSPPQTRIEVDEARREEWESFVEGHPQATSCHLWGWRDVIERTFGHRASYLIARRSRESGGEICGALPLVRMRSAIFGRFVSSMPYLNYGGFLASEAAVEEALLGRAVEIAAAERARSIELRHIHLRSCPAEVKQHKVTMLVDLAEDDDAQWKTFDAKLRNQIRKPTREGLTADPEGRLEDFYAVFSRNMRDLGTPVYPRSFFENIRKAFPEKSRIITVQKGGRVMAAGFLIGFREKLEIPWASSIREYNPLCPNNLLYWESLRFGIRSGYRVFDMGRSTPGEGTYRFKEQWGAKPTPLHWQYWLRPGQPVPDRSPKNDTFGLAIRIWRKLPLSVAGFLGPRIARGIP